MHTGSPSQVPVLALTLITKATQSFRAVDHSLIYALQMAEILADTLRTMALVRL